MVLRGDFSVACYVLLWGFQCDMLCASVGISV